MAEEERIDLDRTFQISSSISKGDGQWRPARFRERLVSYFAANRNIGTPGNQGAEIQSSIVGHWIGIAFYLYQLPSADTVLTPDINGVDVSSTYGSITIVQNHAVNVGDVAFWPTPVDIIATDELSWITDGATIGVTMGSTYILQRL